MSVFSLVADGTKSVKRVTFPLISGRDVTCGVRVLLDEDDDAIDTAARKAAVDRGVAEPRSGEPIYDRWKQRFTLLYACVAVPEDASDPIPDTPALFFDGGVEQIQKNLDRERIAYLFGLQEQWQALVSPRPRDMNRDEYMNAVFAHATAGLGDELPFWRWHPALQESFLVTTACLVIGSPVLRSLSGSDSEASSTSSTHLPSEVAGVNHGAVVDEAFHRGNSRANAIGGRVHETELAEHAARRTRTRAPKPRKR